MTDLEKAVGRVLALVHTSGLKDFGRYPKGNANALQEIAKVYAFAVSNEPGVTQEIVEMTAKRYLTRKVWIWNNGSHDAPTEFPTSSQFADACKQTLLEEYANLPIGEIEEDGYHRLVTVTVPKGISAKDFANLAMRKRRELGIQEPVKVLPSKSSGVNIEEVKRRVHETLGIGIEQSREHTELEAAERLKQLRRQA